MKNFKTVLFISPNYKNRKGGIASVLALYSRYLKKKFNYNSSIYFQNIYLSTLLFPINYIAIAFKLLTNRQIQIVHIHGSHGGSFIRKYMIYKLAKGIFTKKVVYHLHSSHFYKFYSEASNSSKKKIRNIINNVDLLIVLSEEWQDYFLKTFAPQRIQILENVVSKQKEISLQTETPPLKLLFLGRIGNRKGIFDLIDVLLKNADTALLRVELTIGGDGEIARLKKKIADKNLKNINFVGWVRDKEKEELIRNTHVFILPSYDEGLPISILEAMSFKKPIIATEVGGIPRILRHKQNGFLIEAGNKNQLWNAINYYIENPQHIEKHGTTSLDIVQDYFPEKALSKLDKMYEDIL